MCEDVATGFGKMYAVLWSFNLPGDEAYCKDICTEEAFRGSDCSSALHL